MRCREVTLANQCIDSLDVMLGYTTAWRPHRVAMKRHLSKWGSRSSSFIVLGMLNESAYYSCRCQYGMHVLSSVALGPHSSSEPVLRSLNAAPEEVGYVLNTYTRSLDADGHGYSSSQTGA